MTLESQTARNDSVARRPYAPAVRRCALIALAALACGAAAPPPDQAPENGALASAYATPRATVSTFLDAMNAYRAGEVERVAAALACLDLGETSDTPAHNAIGLAQQLYEVIDHFTLQLDEIPETAEHRAEVVLEDPEDGLEDGLKISLVLRERDDGVWRFTAETLAQAPAYHARLPAEPDLAEPSAAANPKLRSPRATMRTFLEGMDRWDKPGGREDVLSTLDLSDISEQIRGPQGELIADYLKQVLDRDRVFVAQEIHDDPRGESYLHLSHPKGNVVLVPVPVRDTGEVEWKFSADTVETLPDLYEEYKDRPVVTGEADTQPKVFSLRLRNWVAGHVPFLTRRNVLLENWQWLGLFTIILAGMAFSRLLTGGLLVIVRKRFRLEAIALEKHLEKSFVRPIRIALMAWVWFLGLRPLGLPATAMLYLHSAAKTVSATAAVWAVYRLVDIVGRFLSERATRSDNKFDDILVPLIIRSLKVLVVVFGIVFVADTLELDYKGLLAGLGIGGLAFALAAKDTVSNIFGSLTILFDRPFQIGDWVIIGDAEGSVETVGIRSTRIRTFYNSLVAVPNSQLINATVDNMGARRYRRIKTMIAVTYDTPPEKIEAFCEGMRHLIRTHPYTRKDYYHCWLNAFADSSLNILLYCFHEVPDWSTELRERHRLFLDIIRLAERLGVEFAFPTQTLYMRPETESPPGPAPPGPDSAEAAFVLGRKEAERIVQETLGKDAPPPPPVTFEDRRPTALEDRGDAPEDE